MYWILKRQVVAFKDCMSWTIF